MSLGQPRRRPRVTERRPRTAYGPTCTIARELRNRLQHDVLGSSHRYGPIPALRDTPRVPKVVGLRVRWRDVLDRIEGRGSRKRKEQLEDACGTEFPELDEIDVFTVINEHLRCLSTIMKNVRRQWPPDDLIAVHRRLAQQREFLQQGEPWSRYVVSPKGKMVHLKLAEDNVDQNRAVVCVRCSPLCGGVSHCGPHPTMSQSVDVHNLGSPRRFLVERHRPGSAPRWRGAATLMRGVRGGIRQLGRTVLLPTEFHEPDAWP